MNTPMNTPMTTNLQVSEAMRILATKIVNKPTPLGHLIEKEMQARNDGFPKWMYHSSLDPQHVVNPVQADALRLNGYSDNYIHREWPKHFMRRNYGMRDEYIPGTDRIRSVPMFSDYIEGREVAKPEQGKMLLEALPENDNVSAWFDNASKLPVLELSVREAPAVTIARLEGKAAGGSGKLTDDQIAQIIASGALDTVIAAAVAAASKKFVPAKP